MSIFDRYLDPFDPPALEPERLGMYTRAMLSVGVAPPRPRIPVRMMAPIDHIAPERRAMFLRRMCSHRLYRNLSRRRKVELRRALLRVEVCAI